MSNFILLIVAAIIIVGIALELDPKVYIAIAMYVLFLCILANAPSQLLLTYFVLGLVLTFVHIRNNSKGKRNVGWSRIINFFRDVSKRISESIKMDIDEVQDA